MAAHADKLLLTERFAGLTGSSKSALAELAAEKVADSPKWAPRPTRYCQLTKPIDDDVHPSD
jgi:hypothetical protein